MKNFATRKKTFYPILSMALSTPISVPGLDPGTDMGVARVGHRYPNNFGRNGLNCIFTPVRSIFRWFCHPKFFDYTRPSRLLSSKKEFGRFLERVSTILYYNISTITTSVKTSIHFMAYCLLILSGRPPQNFVHSKMAEMIFYIVPKLLGGH